MNGYRVLKGFWHHSKRYEPEDPIQLTPQEAVHLLRAGKVSPETGSKRGVEKKKSAPLSVPSGEKREQDEVKKEGEKQ